MNDDLKLRTPDLSLLDIIDNQRISELINIFNKANQDLKHLIFFRFEQHLNEMKDKLDKKWYDQKLAEIKGESEL